MRSIDLAYIAGMLDGEGCLTLSSRNVAIGRTWTNVVCEINNNYKPVLDWIITTLKFGNVYTKKRKHGLTYTAKFNSTTTKKLLPLIRPYLKIKHKQADILFEYFTILANNKNTLDKNRKAQIDALYWKIKPLNHRGAPIENGV